MPRTSGATWRVKVALTGPAVNAEPDPLPQWGLQRIQAFLQVSDATSLLLVIKDQ